MKANASRSSELTLAFDFSSKKRLANSIEGYARELAAGLSRNQWSQKQLAEKAGVSTGTVTYHLGAQILSPQIRTIFSLLFAIGYDSVTIEREGKVETRRRDEGVA